jgi:hypothetical protein
MDWIEPASGSSKSFMSAAKTVWPKHEVAAAMSKGYFSRMEWSFQGFLSPP